MSIKYPVVMFLYEEQNVAPVFGNFGIHSRSVSFVEFLRESGVEVGDFESDDQALRQKHTDLDLVEWMIFGLSKGFSRSAARDAIIRSGVSIPIEQFYRAASFRVSMKVAYNDFEVMHQMTVWRVPIVQGKKGVLSPPCPDNIVDPRTLPWELLPPGVTTF